MNDYEDLDELTEEERHVEELAQEAERLIDDDLADWSPVKVRIAKNVKHVYSFRVGAEELDEIADAAEAAGRDLSAFIREAALNEARRRKAGGSAVDEVRKKAEELAEAVQRL